MKIDSAYIEEKGGILNALTYASAQYIFKVLERHGKEKIKWFEHNKTQRLKRTIIHKNAHLDEYFAELIFRSILPPHLKDIEILEHVLMSKEDDSFAKLSWPSGVVFGIHSDEAGGAKALSFYDEHNSDGSRAKPSCSQLVAEEYLGNNIPNSIQKVLNEVNYSDSHSGAHQYNIKNVFFAMHDIMFAIGRDEIHDNFITKYLTGNWKRAIIDACLVSMIYIYENNILPDKFDDSLKNNIERITKKSLDYFIEKTILSSTPNFYDDVKKDLLFKFRNGNHVAIDKAIWRNENGQMIDQQILIVHLVCYSLQKCWGDNIANFVMLHIWQILFQDQMSFLDIKDEIINITESTHKGNTRFGYIEKIIIDEIHFKPQQSIKDTRKRTLNLDSPLWFYDVSVSNPSYPNVAKVLKSIINNEYAQKGNNGFGIFILHDKTINSKMINNGPTIPKDLWIHLSDKIVGAEPECWFQLKDAEGVYADFILNRNKSHQEYLPSNIVNKDFLLDIIKDFR
ncbi:MAG: hypothetical protein KF816_08475 [Melioribacteraceae bacterium]|nr:hypothetical protein [Melioribacteraceae bacterium]